MVANINIYRIYLNLCIQQISGRHMITHRSAVRNCSSWGGWRCCRALLLESRQDLGSHLTFWRKVMLDTMCDMIWWDSCDIIQLKKMYADIHM